MKKILLSAGLFMLACTEVLAGGPPTAVSMQRTSCFGRCPEYTVTVNRDGYVTYTGVRFTDYTGTYRKFVGKEQAAELLSEFHGYRVDTCQADYPEMVSDVPGINYSIQYRGSDVQTIHNAHFGPVFLRELARYVDELAKVDNSWKKVK